jgi:hypothetical protein
MSDDHSPGDRREPYSDQGGPAGRHAQTHDVRREELTNPKGAETVDESFELQLHPNDPELDPLGHAEESLPADQLKDVVNNLPELTADELARLSVLELGTELEQGGVYLDLDDAGRVPFKALGGHRVQDGQRIVSKRDTDYLLWNQLVGDRGEVEIERPV